MKKILAAAGIAGITIFIIRDIFRFADEAIARSAAGESKFEKRKFY